MINNENKLTDKEIYQKVKKRIRKEKDYELVIELEKEIDIYRNRIRNMKETSSDDNLIWFKLNQNTNSEQLHVFLLKYIPMGTVLELYRLLKEDFLD